MAKRTKRPVLPTSGKTFGIEPENLELQVPASTLPEGHSQFKVTAEQRKLSTLRSLARDLRTSYQKASDEAVKKLFYGYYNDGHSTPPDQILRDVAAIVRRTSPSTFSVHCLHNLFIAVYDDLRIDRLDELNPIIFIKVSEHDPA